MSGREPAAGPAGPSGPATPADVVQRRREAVLAVLQATPGYMATALLEDYCAGQADRDVLDYEDWASPMRVSGGEVCLVAAFARGTIWWTVDHGDRMRARLEGRFGDDEVELAEAVGMLRAAMQEDVLEPILVDETPFEEAD